MSILYINPLATEILFLVFRDDETISKTLQKNMETASSFPKLLVDLVDQYKIQEIFCITGPGPFTLMRVITLSINALTYTRGIQIKSGHFFDLIKDENVPIIEANTREYLIRENGTDITLTKENLKQGSYEGIFSENLSTDLIKYIQYTEIRGNIVHFFSTRNSEKWISPIYFKPPHITCPKL